MELGIIHRKEMVRTINPKKNETVFITLFDCIGCLFL